MDRWAKEYARDVSSGAPSQRERQDRQNGVEVVDEPEVGVGGSQIPLKYAISVESSAETRPRLASSKFDFTCVDEFEVIPLLGSFDELVIQMILEVGCEDEHY